VTNLQEWHSFRAADCPLSFMQTEMADAESMSALGQKRTWAAQNGMSAFPR